MQLMKYRIPCWAAVFATVVGVESTQLAGAESGLEELRVIRILPRSEREIADLHERARAHTCEPVSANEPLEITGFTPCLTDRDRREWDRGVLLPPSSRRHLFTIGLDMLSDDKARLPTVSGGQILRYLQTHFVSVQARIQKDSLTGELFLHHRPLAITAVFGRGALTQDFTDATLEAIREFRSLGILLDTQEPRQPRNLRTLVLTYRSVAVSEDRLHSTPTLQPKYEYVFIRARESGSAPNPTLTLSAFATSDQRRRLHWLQPWSLPRQARDCGVHANVLFTKYSTLGLIPTKSATRDVEYNARNIFTWDELNQRVRDRGWKGDALDNLTPLLDLILDGNLQQ